MASTSDSIRDAVERLTADFSERVAEAVACVLDYDCVWLVIEEIETGQMEGGGTYAILGAYLSEEGADFARDEWRKHHGEPDHEFVGDADADWCGQCGHGVTVESVEVSE